MAIGAMGENLRRVASPTKAETGGSAMLNEANVDKLVARLSRMRGAALKLGQMLSFQGECSTSDK